MNIRKIILLGLCVCFHTVVCGQMWEDNLQITQKEGTDELLKEYLSSVDCDADTVYAILYAPSYCPRCEVSIPEFPRDLKAMFPQDKTLLISVYGDADAARHYVQRKKYHADGYLYDTTNDYARIFDFNSHGMIGLYILKIDKKNGRLIVGGEPLDYNKEFIKSIHNQTLPMPYNTFKNTVKHPAEQNEVSYKNGLIYETYTLRTDPLFPVSGVYGMPVLKDDIFVYTDELAESAYYFKINRHNKTFDFVKQIVVDSIERDKYVDLPPDIYKWKKENNSFFYIALSPNFIGKNTLALSYSLPRVFMESPDNLVYYNEACIIARDAYTLRKQPIIELDFQLHNDSYMYRHFSFYPLRNNEILLSCQKLTWPMGFDPEEYKGNPDMDPFMDAFYDGDTPYWAIFDTKTGKMKKRFGELESCLRLSRTGYNYLNPVADSHKKEIFYGNGYTGQLYLADVKKPEDVKMKLSVFEVDTKHFPVPDSSSFYKQEHGRIYDKFFNRVIESVALTDNAMYCLVATINPDIPSDIQSKTYEFITIEKGTKGKVYSYPLIKQNADERWLVCGLAKMYGEVVPYYFGKQNGKAYLRFIRKAKAK